MRLFAAVKLPGYLKEKIESQFLDEIHARGLKKIKKENLHITLCFIGETGREKCSEIISNMQKINHKKFLATATGAGSFGNRVLWVGIQQGAEEIAELARMAGEAGWVNEERFHAHITLARNKNATGKEFEKTLQKISAVKFSETFEVGSLSLMSSELTARGPVYEEVWERTF